MDLVQINYVSSQKNFPLLPTKKFIVSVQNKFSHEDIQWYDMYTLVYLRIHERTKRSSHDDYSMDQHPPQGG